MFQHELDSQYLNIDWHMTTAYVPISSYKKSAKVLIIDCDN